MYSCPYLKFYVLNLVNSFSDWTPSGGIFGIHESSVNLKDPPKISPLENKPPKYKRTKNSYEPL